MGCFHSKDRGEIYSETPNPGAVKRNGVAASGANGAQQPPQYLLEAGPQSVLFNPNNVLTPASGNSQNKYAIPNSPYTRGSGGGAGSFIALGANGGSVTGINRRTSAGKGAHVSADLNAIVDDQGTINALVSRQLSVMSHYSVKSEAGSVILQPEVAHGPNALGFTLQKLIGRGGFGNVYLGEWEGRRVAVKVVTGNNNEGQNDQVGAVRTQRRIYTCPRLTIYTLQHVDLEYDNRWEAPTVQAAPGRPVPCQEHQAKSLASDMEIFLYCIVPHEPTSPCNP